MQRLVRIVIPLVALAANRGEAQDADVIVRNARIWTGDSTRPYAEAAAVRGDRFVAVGTTAEIGRHQATHTRIVDAGGRFVAPGFIDNHTHFERAGALILGVNLLDVADEVALVRRVREARQRLPRGAWLVGGEWGAYEAWAVSSVGGGRAAGGGGIDSTRAFRPHRTMIDSITPQTPALLSKWDRSVFLANGRALDLAGATCAWDGVECDGGRPTGRLTPAAAERIRRAVPAKSLEQRLAESRAALAQLTELGVTGIHDNTGPEQLRVYEELRRRGELTVRVYARPTLDKWDELRAAGIRHGFGDEWIKIGGLKGFVDGIMGNSTARFYEPQLHSGQRGDWRDMMSPAGNMERLIAGADTSGHWPQIHAIGDEAIDTLLAMYETVIRRRPRPADDRRWRVIHAQVLRGPHVAERMARLGLIAEVQPYHAIDDMRWMEERIGQRARWAYAFNTLRRAGVLVTFGSDWPGTNAAWYTANPLHGIYAAVTRQTLAGEPRAGWFPEERVDVEFALRAYTVHNAYAAGEERVKGKIAPGYLADLVMLDADPLRVAPARLKDVKVLLTIVGGRTVYDARAGGAPRTE
ncbi:MAG: amidohydrolase [Gemmatimonadaceae bacterium]